MKQGGRKREDELASDREKWEAQFYEPEGAFALFEAYLELGPGRSLLALHDAKKGRRDAPTYARLRETASKWRWVERARSYDEARELIAIGSDDVRRAKFNLGLLGERMREKALRAIEDLEPGAIRPATIPALVKASQELILLSKGEPTEIHEERVSPEVRAVLERIKDMGDDEIERTLAELKGGGDRASRGGAGEPPEERSH